MDLCESGPVELVSKGLMSSVKDMSSIKGMSSIEDTFQPYVNSGNIRPIRSPEP